MRTPNIGADNGLSPGQRQAIIWINAGILLIWTLETNFSEILSEIDTFSVEIMRLKMASAKWRPFWLGLNVVNASGPETGIPRIKLNHVMVTGLHATQGLNSLNTKRCLLGIGIPITNIRQYDDLLRYMMRTNKRCLFSDYEPRTTCIITHAWRTCRDVCRDR